MTASDIIELFSAGAAANDRGVAELARAMGIPMTTVSSWGRTNYIPDWRQPKVLELAASRGLRLSTADFPTEAERIRLGKVA